VRGPRIASVRIAALDAAAQPPAIVVEVAVTGRRYVEDRDTAAVLSGSPARDAAFTEQWRFTLDGPAGWPWRLSASGAPVVRT
jgi:predicted lipid-binding transport protein (Tim44 family)